MRYPLGTVQPPPDLTLAEQWLGAKRAPERKRLGQWVTPWWVCTAVVDRLAPDLPSSPTVVDPACGDGRWLLAMGRRCPGARLIGIDVDPTAIETARKTLARAGVHADLRCADALSDGPWPASDAVIGNPPYVRPQHLPRDVARDLWHRFTTATDKSDLFCCFVERALDQAPHVALVIGSLFLSLTSFSALRTRLLNTGIDGVFTIPRSAFDATVDTAVVFASAADRRHCGVLDETGFQATGQLHVDPVAWSLDGPLPTLRGTALAEDAMIHMGIVCGDYSRYVLQERSLPEDHPTCRGRDVRRWLIEDPGLFVRYRPTEMLKRKPYVAPKHAGLFDVDCKIVLAGATGRQIVGAMDTARRFPMDSCYVMHAKHDADPWALLGFLLSQPVQDWYGARFPAPRVKGVELAQIPLPPGDWSAVAKAARAADDRAVDEAVRAAYEIA